MFSAWMKWKAIFPFAINRKRCSPQKKTREVTRIFLFYFSRLGSNLFNLILKINRNKKEKLPVPEYFTQNISISLEDEVLYQILKKYFTSMSEKNVFLQITHFFICKER